ncbi:colicin E3-like toxin immunity protein [Pseudomonas sp. AMR01]|uniref:colicin E3-like toxin immunity protein n=1 Tax=Pseudomonas sp. AMR01 TaxID=3064904 RepID=UPI0035C1574A
MVMKIRLEWFDKLTENLEADEYSTDVEEDSILKALDLHNELQIYAGGFNILPSWITLLQPHFQHVIAPNLYDYQISFHYQGAWPPPPKNTRKES